MYWVLCKLCTVPISILQWGANFRNNSPRPEILCRWGDFVDVKHKGGEFFVVREFAPWSFTIRGANARTSEKSPRNRRKSKKQIKMKRRKSRMTPPVCVLTLSVDHLVSH